MTLSQAVKVSIFIASFLYCIHAFELPYHHTLFKKNCCAVIAHAGGGIENQAYTNSKEALDSNYALGRRIFELDFDKTSDGVWVLTHDWESWSKQVKQDNHIPPLSEFLKTKILGQYTPLTLSDLEDWLKAHPDASVITDTKNIFADFFDAMHASKIDPQKIIYQAYTVDDLSYLKNHSIELNRVIYTNYKTDLSEEALITLFKDENIGALTIPVDRAQDYSKGLIQALPETPIYVHGPPPIINSLELQAELKERGYSGFYIE